MSLLTGINKISNKNYHSDKNWLSSSSLKKLLKDPALFYKEEILKDKGPEVENANFTKGSYMHSLVLEKHLIDQEYAFFEGMRKQGNAWELFKQANQGKTILSKAQKMEVEYWLKAHEQNETAKELLTGGEPEMTVAHVWNDVPIKVRADYANVEKGYLVDLKSSSYAIDKDSFVQTCNSFGYLLSAALYCKIFEIEFNKPFDFYFDVVCKTEQDCRIYKVSSESKMKGLQECLKALDIYKQCAKTGIWEKKQSSDQNLSNLEIEEI
jgi:exodeoxyribonuclease VIII